jgi:hypothetical protein
MFLVLLWWGKILYCYCWRKHCLEGEML